MTKVGIVGFGKMGILHAGILNALPGSKVTAICENESLVFRAAKKVLKEAAFYNDVSKMMTNESLDAVFITSPTNTHSSIIHHVLESDAKVGLFSEKPLAVTGLEASEAANAATKHGIVSLVGFHKRFSPVFAYARKLLDGGAIGELREFKCSSYSADVLTKGTGWRFRRGTGGVLLDLGPHLLDLLLWCFGEPKDVSAVERSIYSSDVEDDVHADVAFQSGLKGTLAISWSQSGYRLPEIRIEVKGSTGSMVVTDDDVSIETSSAVKGLVEAGSHIFQKPSFNTSVDFLLAEPEYTIEDQFFLKAVENHSLVEPSFNTAIKVNEFVDLIHKAAES